MSGRSLNRAAALFNSVIAAAMWPIFLLLALRDWTLIIVPLFYTCVVAFQWVALRKVYGVPPCRHRNAIPVESVLGEVVAKLCPDCGDQLDAGYVPPRETEKETTARWERDKELGNAGAFETLTTLRRERKDYLRISGFRTACPEGHGEQMWVQGRGRVCPACEHDRRLALAQERYDRGLPCDCGSLPGLPCHCEDDDDHIVYTPRNLRWERPS